jgi:hypothetical protein
MLVGRADAAELGRVDRLYRLRSRTRNNLSHLWKGSMVIRTSSAIASVLRAIIGSVRHSSTMIEGDIFAKTVKLLLHTGSLTVD